MLRPSIFGESLFDDWMDDFPFGKEFEKTMFPAKDPLYGKHAKNMMKTDVRETDDAYEVDIDLPGFKKDEVTAELNDGYITISAAKGLDKDEKDKIQALDGTDQKDEHGAGDRPDKGPEKRDDVGHADDRGQQRGIGEPEQVAADQGDQPDDQRREKSQCHRSHSVDKIALEGFF